MLEQYAVFLLSSFVCSAAGNPMITTASGTQEIDAQAVRPSQRSTTAAGVSTRLSEYENAVWQLQAPFFNSYNPNNDFQPVTPFRRVTVESRNEQIPRAPMYLYPEESLENGKSHELAETNT